LLHTILMETKEMHLVMLLKGNAKMIVCRVSAIEFIEISHHNQVLLIFVQDQKSYHSLTTIKYSRTLKIHVPLILGTLKYCLARECHGIEVTYWIFLIEKVIMG
jgi:predicted fused transcriptional regulator/phosphomethylpyrimidine kinase